MAETAMDLKCYHGFAAVVYTSTTPSHPGRQFYRCPKPIGDKERCTFFLWADEAESHHKSKLPPTPQLDMQASQSTVSEPPFNPSPPKKRTLSLENTTPPSPKRPKLESGAFDSPQSVDYQGKAMPETPQNLPGVQSFTTPAYRHPQTHPYGPDSASQETMGGKSKELSAESVEEMILCLSGLPAYVRKLEIRKIVAEKSRDAKADKIKFLEAEVERLRKREKGLEDLVAVLEST